VYTLCMAADIKIPIVHVLYW